MLSETMVSGVYYPRRPEVKKELTYTATPLSSPVFQMLTGLRRQYCSRRFEDKIKNETAAAQGTALTQRSHPK